MAVPGLTPRFPLITVRPLLVTVEQARTPNVPTVRSKGYLSVQTKEKASTRRGARLAYSQAVPFIRSLRFKLADAKLYKIRDTHLDSNGGIAYVTDMCSHEDRHEHMGPDSTTSVFKPRIRSAGLVSLHDCATRETGSGRGDGHRFAEDR